MFYVFFPFFFFSEPTNKILNNKPPPTPQKNPKFQFTHHHNSYLTTKYYQIDIMDLYYMHPNDNPGISIVSPHLNNLNYHSLSRSVDVALHSKNKLGFLDRTLKCPDDSDWLTLVWDMCNTMVMAWVTNSIDIDIAQSILWMETVHKIWVELRE